MSGNGIVHLTRLKGRLAWSGDRGTGGGEGGVRDSRPHAIAARIDMGVPVDHYHIGDDSRLYLHRGRSRDLDFTPEGLLLAARCGYFGLKVVEGGTDG